MSKRSRAAVISAAGLLLAVLPASAKPKAVVMKTAVIENTGSTNTSGYKITVLLTSGGYRLAAVSTDGQIQNSEMGNRKLLSQQVQTFFADLEAAMPLTALPVRHGMRSASFGTQTFIMYKGQKSPDLTFASDPRTTALKTDIDNMTKAVHVRNVPRRPIVIHADR